MRDCRRAINLRPRHNVPSAALPSLRRPAGEENCRAGGSRGIIRREVGVLERDIADDRDVINVADGGDLDPAPLAVRPVGPNRLELMAENVQRQPLESLRLGPVDKRENLLVDGHKASRNGPGADDHGIAARAHSILTTPAAAPFYWKNGHIYLALEMF